MFLSHMIHICSALRKAQIAGKWWFHLTRPWDLEELGGELLTHYQAMESDCRGCLKM